MPGVGENTPAEMTRQPEERPLRVHVLTSEIVPERFDLAGFAELYRAWEEARARRGGALPAWGDLDPERLAACRDNLMLLEVIDGGRDYRYLVYGRGIARHFGRDMTGRRTSELPPRAARLFIEIYQRILRERVPYFSRSEAAASVSVAYWDRLMLPLSDDGERIDRIVATNYPRAWRVPPERYLELREGLNALDQGLCVLDRERRLVVWNQRFLEIAGVPDGVCRVGMRIEELRELARWPELPCAELAAEGSVDEREQPDGTVIEVRTRVLPEGGSVTTFTDVTGQRRAAERLTAMNAELERRVRERTAELSAAVAGLRDEVAARRRVERALQLEKERAEVTLHSIGDGVITCAADGTVTYLNPMAEQLTGFALDEACGRGLGEVLALREERSGEPLTEPLGSVLGGARASLFGRHAVLVARDGRRHTVSCTAAPILAPGSKEASGAVVVFSDVTESRRLHRQIAHQASHDMLTGLANRQAFEARLRRMLHGERRGDVEHALCYLDLDRFKQVNDRAGHGAGDELLRRLALLLNGRVRGGDLLARLGGDEFGLLMERCRLSDALRVAEELRALIEGFRLSWEGEEFRIGVSIGVVPVTGGASVAEVLRDADAACYAAKEAGRNRIHVFREDDARLARRYGDLRWLERIGEAIEGAGLRLFHQPIRGAADGALVGHELLLRMVDGSGGLIGPGTFLPAAERYHMMPRIDRAVVGMVCRWLTEADPPASEWPLCFINLSGQSLGEEGFGAFILETLGAHGIAGERLCFEVTETAAIANLEQAIAVMDLLGRHGCRFALDDFGSGLSSFAYLRDLPAELIKIDGAFVRGVASDPVDRSLVQAINDMGHLMGKRTVAEHVDDAATLAVVREIGVDLVQGNHIGEPRPLPVPAGGAAALGGGAG